MNYGRAFKAVREELGWTRPQVADRLGITRGALWKIENGKVIPKPQTIVKFCVEANIPPAYFYISAFTKEDFFPARALLPILQIPGEIVNDLEPKHENIILYGKDEQ